MSVVVLDSPFRPWEALGRHESAMNTAGKFGASAIFVGTMRDFNEGETVRGMLLEHYPGMTERHLEGICEQAAKKWQLVDTLVIHRVGELRPGDPIVLVAVWSAHRKDAFEACRHIMEELKSQAPFWKKELLDTGTRWVEGNTPGY